MRMFFEIIFISLFFISCNRDEKINKEEPIHGVKMKYEKVDQETLDSLSKSGLTCKGIIRMESGDGHDVNDTIPQWSRFTILYSYRQPIGIPFNIDSVEISEFINSSGCFYSPHDVYFLEDIRRGEDEDSTFIADNPYNYEGMPPRYIEKFNMSYITRAPFYRIIPLCFFDAKKKNPDPPIKNNEEYWVKGATFFMYYNCKDFDTDRLIEDAKFKSIVMNRDTSIVLISKNYKLAEL